MPSPIPLDRVLDSPLRERDLGRGAVAERLAAPDGFGDRGLVLGKELPGTVRPAHVCVEPRESDVRPVRSGNGGEGVPLERRFHLAPRGIGCVVVVHVDHREPDRVFDVFAGNAALLVHRHRPV